MDLFCFLLAYLSLFSYLLDCLCVYYLLCSLCLSLNYKQYLGGLFLITLFCLCFRFFLLICLTSCFLVFSCCLTPPPSYLINSLRPSSPFMDIYEPPILCVCLFLLLVCMCVCGHVHMLLRRTHMYFLTHKVHKCMS